ncbi:hypothetical protein DI270_007710 [Microbispora triticiradicis]|uniref:SAM-dependent methyltransferase n=1 Tax=Microbispora triticiradicis TaxID=2200763 RepID=A0ABX9LNL0_9ACTN|nr:hypothetical protein DI270_007710 [Microbispora triticiradicis]
MSGSSSERFSPVRHLPLSVWLTAPEGQSLATCANGCCMPVTGPLARQLITTCTRADGLVVDVHPADHALVANAVALSRRVSTVVIDPAVAGVIWTRATTGRDEADRRRVDVRIARAEATYLALAHRRGEAALVVVRRTCESEPNVTTIDGSLQELAEPAALLAPGGHLVVVTGLHLIQGRPHDPVPGLIRAAQRAGLVYLQHIVAVYGPIRRRQIVSSLLPAQSALSKAQAVSPYVPTALRAHADLLIFTKPHRPPASAGICPCGEEEA